jgi:hypothetical protein
MDIESWFKNGTGLDIRELRYLKTPPLPYNIFIDNQIYRGADMRNNIIEHNLTIEHYFEKKENSNEEIINKFLKNEEIHYEKDTEWLEEEKMFVTVYQLDTFLEKIRKEN